MLKSFIFETVNNPGTGPFGLLGPVTGRRAYMPAFGSGAKVLYVADNNAGGFESGWGVVDSVTNQLSRNVTENHLGTTSPVNFTGVVDVYAYPGAAHTVILTDTGMLAKADGTRLVGRGAVAKMTNDTVQDIPLNTITAVNFNAVEYDDAGIWSAGAPSRVTVPAGATRVRLAAGVEWQGNNIGLRQAWIRKNGAGGTVPVLTAGLGGFFLASTTSTSAPIHSLSGGVVPVVPGDYFELVVRHTSTLVPFRVQSATGETVWLSMELLP